MDLDNRIEELETELAFQKMKNEENDNYIKLQQKQLYRLEKIIEKLKYDIEGLKSTVGKINDNEKPPHY